MIKWPRMRKRSSRTKKVTLSPSAPWWKVLNDKLDKNRASVNASVNDKTLPLNYYAALNEVRYTTIGMDYHVVMEIQHARREVGC